MGLVPLINKETSYITQDIACCSRTERGCAMATSMCTVNNGNTPPTTTAGTVVHQRTHSPARTRYICTSDQRLLVLPTGAKSVRVERVPRKKSICLETRSMTAQKTSFIYLINMPFFFWARSSDVTDDSYGTRKLETGLQNKSNLLPVFLSFSLKHALNAVHL